MNIFLRLLAGHMVGDFALQTGRIAEMKRVSVQGLLYHVLMVTGATALFLIPSSRWWLSLLLVFIVHLAIDSVRILFVFNLKRGNTLYFLVDQSIHITVLVLIAHLQQPTYPLSARALFHPHSLWDRLSLLITALVVLLFTVPVVEALIAMDIADVAARQTPQISMRMRLVGALERSIGFLLMQTFLAYLVPLVFVPHFLYRLVWKTEGSTAYNIMRPTLSFLSTCIIGWLVRTA